MNHKEMDNDRNVHDINSNVYVNYHETEQHVDNFMIVLYTLSQLKPSTSTNSLMISAIAIEGWVSFSWMATCKHNTGDSPKRQRLSFAQINNTATTTDTTKLSKL